MIEQVQDQMSKRMQWALNHPTICLAPYNTIDVRHSSFKKQDIYQTCCCNLDESLFVPSTGDDAFAEIKQQQLEGEWPSACYRCWKEELNGGQSERLRAFAELPQDKFENFVLDQRINEFEFRIKFSNLCSLACRSCSESESSTFGKITNASINELYEADISDDEEHWKFITTRIPELIKKAENFFVHFIGGETLIQPGMTRLLQWMVATNIAPRIHVRLTTAITVNPSDELMTLLAKFKSVDINLSIDSVGENYQYVRWPARFSKIESNLSALIEYQATLTVKNGRKIRVPKWKCAVSPVFSLNNIFYIDDWLEYWYQWYKQRNIVFHNFVANLTMQTNHLDIQALPTQYRSQLIASLRKCLLHPIFETYPAQLAAVYNFLNITIAELENNQPQEELWEKFLRHTAYFDQKTKLSFAIFNQRLYNILSTQDREKFRSIVENTNSESTLTQAMTFTRTNVQSQI
jgi:MoaA/NifB/PqqE/SkfB family radical SAM enzyme